MVFIKSTMIKLDLLEIMKIVCSCYENHADRKSHSNCYHFSLRLVIRSPFDEIRGFKGMVLFRKFVFCLSLMNFIGYFHSGCYAC